MRPQTAIKYHIAVVIGFAVALLAAITVATRTGLVDRRLAWVVCYVVAVVAVAWCWWIAVGHDIETADEKARQRALDAEVRKAVIADLDTAQYPVVPTQGGVYQTPHPLDDGLRMRMLAELSSPPPHDDIT